MKIYLCDNILTGHHKLYEQTLNKIKNTEICNFETEIIAMKQNIIKAFLTRYKFFKSIQKEKEKSIIHLLCIDPLYKFPFIEFLINNKKNKFIGTLHWIPDNKFMIYLLKKFSKKLEYIVVHSEYLKEKLDKQGIKNVVCINYPTFINNSVKKNLKNKNMNNDEIIISCIGGTRNDKGLDILIDAFKYIKEDVKGQLVFNICGIEQDIKFADIANNAKKYGIRTILKNKFLTDEEYLEEIVKSDVILLPYKKMFMGNSGPMTDGIYFDKFILGPEQGNLGFLINKYDLGMCFEQENSLDLAKKISSLKNVNLKKNHAFKDELKIETFINNYGQLYKKIEEKYK